MRTPRILFAIAALTVVMMGAQVGSAWADGPKIDTYNYDGYRTRACARSAGNGRSVYTCRGISDGPYWIDWNSETAWQQVGYGDISGGGDWVVAAYGAMYEGCNGSDGWDLCRSGAVDPRTKSYQTGGQYYWVAVSSWAYNQSVAFTCLYSLFNFDGDLTNCT